LTGPPIEGNMTRFRIENCPESEVMKRLLLLTLAAGAAHADEAAFLRCRGIADSTARLACYDAVPAVAATPKSPPGTLLGSVTPPVPAPTASTVTLPAAPVATTGQRFGLPATVPEAELNRIESRLTGKLEGWGPYTRFRLDNGQVWQVADDSSRMLDLDKPKVAIRRGALGVFYIEFEGTNYSPRVKRVQ
jgi:hypothetical protein